MTVSHTSGDTLGLNSSSPFLTPFPLTPFTEYRHTPSLCPTKCLWEQCGLTYEIRSTLAYGICRLAFSYRQWKIIPILKHVVNHTDSSWVRNLYRTAIALSIYSITALKLRTRSWENSSFQPVFNGVIALCGVLHNTTAQFHYWHTEVIN